FELKFAIVEDLRSFLNIILPQVPRGVKDLKGYRENPHLCLEDVFTGDLCRMCFFEGFETWYLGGQQIVSLAEVMGLEVEMTPMSVREDHSKT
ncbi:hypothetical protein AVEN_197826-1, partial [Araneus ventricosus]